MITLAEAFHASDLETWTTYWSRCRINTIVYKFPDYSAEDNPVLIRYREIPDDENVEEPHPDVEVKQVETPTTEFRGQSHRQQSRWRRRPRLDNQGALTASWHLIF